MIRFDQTVCSNLEHALTKEWLETSGLGGFASSTIAGVNTRRYHGLLTAAVQPPAGRSVLLSKMEETVYVGDRGFDLSANRYPGAVHPEGYRYLREFRLDPFPTYAYQLDEIELEKRVFLVHGEETVVVEYALTRVGSGSAGLRLELRPLIAFRDYHALTRANGSLDGRVQLENGCASVQPYEGLPRMYFAHDAQSVEATGAWYYNFEYDVERERGLDFQEDLYNPFTLSFDLDAKPAAAVIASLEPRTAADAAVLRASEIDRRLSAAGRAGTPDELGRQLALAADQFLVKRGELTTVIAGYPWFADWGRDTMIALPGLTLSLGLTEIAREILLVFAKHVDQGMLPNRFPEAGETPEYNTVDATLWFFEAVAALLDETGDYEFVRADIYPVLCDIVDWHLRGTRYGIRVDDDGLLRAGETGLQLTWMDAKIGDWVVTPRHGKPVEIQALWYNALRILEGLAARFGDEERREACDALAEKARRNFNRSFWNDERDCLFDVIDGNVRDGSVRPNQVFAVSLRHPVLDRERWTPVLRVVERELLTPYGLRTLAPSDAGYCPTYEGGVASRDGAYHQGTVWPWLLGPFIEAHLRLNGDQAAPAVGAMLETLSEHLGDAGLGQISEIFDADAPHRPRGCFAQAWSVAEILRVRRILEQRLASRSGSGLQPAQRRDARQLLSGQKLQRRPAAG